MQEHVFISLDSGLMCMCVCQYVSISIINKGTYLYV